MNRNDLTNWNNSKFYIDPEITIKIMLKRLEGKEVDNPIIIPEYQRDYVWKDSNTSSLLTSLYKGFPIGSIVVWDYSETSEWLLIDGLQRNWTIYKINEKPFNYLNYQMYEYWASKDELIKIDKLDKERFRHMMSSLHHKKKDYKAATLESAKKFIMDSKSTSLDWDKNSKERFIAFLNSYWKWFENDFKKINIPHHVIDNVSSTEVAEIFRIINDSGKKLSNFEIVSASWSRDKITLDKTVPFIKKYADNRIEKYKSNFENSDRLGKKLLSYDENQVIPSNFIVSVMIEALKDSIELRDTFLKRDENKNWTLIDKAMEPAAEIIMTVLKVDFDSVGVDFENLGKALKNKITTKDDVMLFVEKLKSYINSTISAIPILSYVRGNRKGESFAFPAWLITTFIIHIINGPKNSEKADYEKWFIKELLFDNRLNSATGTNAKLIIEKLEFNKSYKKNAIGFSNLKKLITDKINEDDFRLEKYSARNKVVILSMIQKENFTPSSEYQIDHWIPQSKLKSVGAKWIDDIVNLQMLPCYENIGKSDALTEDQIKKDVFKNHYNALEISEMNKSIKQIIEKINNKENSQKEYNEILKIRKKVVLRIIKEADWI